MHKRNKMPSCRKIVLKLPDLDHAKSAVLNSLSCPHSRTNYKFAMEQFISWYCSEPQLALNCTVVLRFRLYLESLGLAAGTVNQRLAAVRRLAYEATDSGLLSPELAAGIRRVKGAKQLGARTGNWLTQDQARLLLENANGDDLRGARDLAMLSVLVGCGLRRAELSALTVEDLQIRQGHWAIVDLVGKGGHIRTIPVPAWVKDAVDRWRESAKVTAGRIFRAVSRHGMPWGRGISENVIWYVVRRVAAAKADEDAARESYEATRTRLAAELALARREYEMRRAQYLQVFLPLRQQAVEISDISREVTRQAGWTSSAYSMRNGRA